MNHCNERFHFYDQSVWKRVQLMDEWQFRVAISTKQNWCKDSKASGQVLTMRALGGRRLQHVLKLRNVSISGYETTEESAVMKLHLQWVSLMEISDVRMAQGSTESILFFRIIRVYHRTRQTEKHGDPIHNMTPITHCVWSRSLSYSLSYDRSIASSKPTSSPPESAI